MISTHFLKGVFYMYCKNCGNEIPEGQEYCADCMVQENSAAAEEKPKKKENVLTGLVGAFLGALLGAGSIILLDQIGFIASISGLILAVCTLKGYELLGGRLSVKGIVISIVLMLLTPYIADRICWAIFLVQELADYGVTFAECFAAVPDLLADGSIEMGFYLKNLLMLYGFALLGAFSTIRGAFKK